MRIKERLIGLGLLTTLAGFCATPAQAGTPPIAPHVIGVTTGTFTMAWGLPGATSGYLVETASTPAFSFVIGSSTTFDTNQSTLPVLSMTPNTTFYTRRGALYAETTAYAAQISTRATLADAV